MFKFEITHRSKVSRARVGILKTDHGEVETPSLVPVATAATIKAITTDQIAKTKTKIIISNTFHLHRRPGEKVVEKAGGINKFMNYRGVTMTDSGGFQVFSLGFGADLGVGKILKFFQESSQTVEKGESPKLVKITDKGVLFKSSLDGKEVFLDPKTSIGIQEKLGADIIFAFDECTPPLASYDYAKSALKRTHKWAVESLEAKKRKEALFGIIQGSHYKELREESAKFIGLMNFEGFGIGGDLGNSKFDLGNILNWTIPNLPDNKPRHLLGIGYLEDFEPVIQAGVDLFDCTVPTHYGRRGIAFTDEGKLNLGNVKFLKDQKPLDKACKCEVCANHTRSYVSHLIRAKEITGMTLLTIHNLFYFNTKVEELREKIKQGKL